MTVQFKPKTKGRGIEWTDETRNSIGGCTHACRWDMPDGTVAECYARELAEKGVAKRAYPHGFEHHYFRPHVLSALHRGRDPLLIFIDSMSDLFAADVPVDDIKKVLGAMQGIPHHAFQSLTKAAPQLLKHVDLLPPNLWVGVSCPPDWMCGSQLSQASRESMLRRSMSVLGEVKEKKGNLVWMSAEPVSWDLTAVLTEDHPLDWIVIGAASNGPKYFQPDPQHVHDLLELMDATGTPVFFKGNIGPLIRSKPFNGDRLNRWREDFPMRYRDGSEIPAVERRQVLCRRHGWTLSERESVPEGAAAASRDVVRSMAAVKANVSRGALGRRLAGIRAAATRYGWPLERLMDREQQARREAVSLSKR